MALQAVSGIEVSTYDDEKKETESTIHFPAASDYSSGSYKCKAYWSDEDEYLFSDAAKLLVRSKLNCNSKTSVER